VIARTALSFSLIFERMPEIVLDRADEEHIVILSQDDDKIQGVVRLMQSPDLYLLVTRQVDPTVIGHMQTARDSIVRYRSLERDMSAMQLQFSLTFGMMALLLLLTSIWAGMRLSVRIIAPIAQLSRAAERVRAGDYTTKVPEGPARPRRRPGHRHPRAEAQRGLFAGRGPEQRRQANGGARRLCGQHHLPGSL
jgi:two-component system nitrogen regulation sensor histidine kinase NtrY